MSDASASTFLTGMVDAVRGSLRPYDALLFVGRCVAWTWLKERYPERISLPDAARQHVDAIDVLALQSAWSRLAAAKWLGGAACAFSERRGGDLVGVSDHQAWAMMEGARQLHLFVADKPNLVRDWILASAWNLPTTEFNDVHAGIAKFLLSLLSGADDLREPEGGFLVAVSDGDMATTAIVAAMDGGMSPAVASRLPPSFAGIVAAVMGYEFAYRNADPFARSGTLTPETTGSGQQWATALVLPPFGMRRDASVSGEFGSLAGEWSGVEFALRNVSGTAVVLVPPSVLFSRSPAERSLRAHLVKSGRLRSVIMFPPGLLRNTAIPFALIVIGPVQESGRVTFCQVGKDDIWEPKGKLRLSTREFVGADRISELLRHPDDSDCVRVAAEQIAAEDHDLSVSTYLKNEPAFFKAPNRSLAKLGDLVEIIKPQHMADATGPSSVEVQEVSPGEAPLHTPLVGSDRRRRIAGNQWEVRRDQALRAGDVLLSVKGTIGRVAVVGNVPLHGVPLLPSLSFVILRQRGGIASIRPEFLAMYLRAPVIQEQLASMGRGATLPNIRLQDLRAFPVWLPSMDRQEAWIDAWEQQGKIEKQINALQEQQHQIASSLWSEAGLGEDQSAPTNDKKVSES